MQRTWALFLISVGVFVAAFAARHALVPDVVPIAVAEDQAPWTLQVAFLLTAIENIGAFGAAVIIVAALAQRIANRVAQILVGITTTLM
jgi:hypothetical protein